MTDRQTFNIGLVLIALGGLVFVANLGLFNGMSGIVGSLVLATGGVLFSRIYFKNKRQVWALPIGFGFFGAAAAVISGDLAGAYFLSILGAGFALIYLQNRRHWWAIIPAGVLATLGLIVGIEEQIPILDDAIAPLLFLGFAATFAFLYFLPEGGKRWAIYPAIAAVIIALLSSSFTGGWLLPLALVAAGVFILRNNKNIDFSFLNGNGSNLRSSEDVLKKDIGVSPSKEEATQEVIGQTDELKN